MVRKTVRQQPAQEAEEPVKGPVKTAGPRPVPSKAMAPGGAKAAIRPRKNVETTREPVNHREVDESPGINTDAIVEAVVNALLPEIQSQVGQICDQVRKHCEQESLRVRQNIAILHDILCAEEVIKCDTVYEDPDLLESYLK